MTSEAECRDVMYVAYEQHLSEADVERIREFWDTAHEGLPRPRLVVMAGVVRFQLVSQLEPALELTSDGIGPAIEQAVERGVRSALAGAL